MDGQGKVIFTTSEYGDRRYRVEYQEVGGYRWESDRYFVKKSSAIARAEDLVTERGISEVRVIDRDRDE